MLVNGAPADNNGAGFAVQDSIIYQQPQSCLAGATLNVTAAVRGTPAAPPTLALTLKVSRGAGIPTPRLQNQTVPMVAGNTVGPYTLYSASATLGAGQGANTRFDVTIGSAVDSFKDTAALGAVCGTLSAGPSTTSTTSTAAASSTTTSATSTTTTADTSTTLTTASSTISTSASSTDTATLSTTASSTTSSTPTTSSTTTAEPTSTTSSTTSASPTSATTSTISISTSSAPTSTSTSSAPLGWSPQGCWTEAINARALTGAASASGSMTNEVCATSCAKYQYFGTEYASECYCGNALDSTANSTAAAECNMPCSGNAGEFCGAGNRLSLYKNTNYVATTPALAGYSYQGCYTDSGPRVLNAKSTSDGARMSYEACAAFCDGYALLGLEYGAECYCGDALAGAASKTPDTDCGMPCAGAPGEVCGGPNRLTVFRAGAPLAHGSNVPGWTYVGCRTDSVGARTLGGGQLYDGGMTLEKCAAYCQARAYFGTEYATECYCGDEFAAGSAVATEGDCGMKCAGNGSEYCGAGDRLSVYAKNMPAP